MNTEPKAGHDGAFIDADDLEAAAEAVAVANGSLAVGARALEAHLTLQRRLRQVRSILVVLILLATAALWLGFIGHGIAWLFDHTLAYPLRGGWDMWPL
jgi:hypothetical protein